MKRSWSQTPLSGQCKRASAADAAPMGGSGSILKAVSILVFAVFVLAAIQGGVGFVLAEETSDRELTATNHTADDIQVVDGAQEFEVIAITEELWVGEENELEISITNTGDANDEHPAEIRERVSTAKDIDVSISATGQNEAFAVSPTEQSIDELAAGDVAVVTFDVTVPQRVEGDVVDFQVTIEYDGVELITYTGNEDDYEILEEEVSQSSDRQTIQLPLVVDRPGAMFYLLWMIPLVFPLALVGLWLGDKTSRRLEKGLNRFARVLFGGFISQSYNKRMRIESAYIDTTYRTYAAKTLLFVVLGFLAGALFGAYLIAGVLLILEPLVRALAGLPRTITRPLGIHPEFTYSISRGTRWLVLIGGGLIIGGIVAGLSYLLRWSLPASTAAVRERGINNGMPQMTAFMYALSRGGMEFPHIIRILTDHSEIYGESAKEMNITVREMDLFGRDMISALRRMSERTPSEQFKTFSENLTSVLQSGSDLSEFFKNQYERYRDEAEERQQEVLELLATIAEAYVTIFVAGVLFFITILLVFGLTVTDTLWLLQGIIYLMIPLANAGFAVFLQQQLDALGISQEGGTEVLDRMEADTPVNAKPNVHKGQPDGGLSHPTEADNRRMLQLYDRVSRVKQALRSPLKVLLWNPTKILWITIPIALIAFAIRAPAAFEAEGVTLRILDDLIIQSVLFVLLTYAIARFVHKRHIRRIEAATPELLERLASLNEAGMSVVEGLNRVRGSDLGVLTPEVERIWRDIEYGSNVDDAMIRFGRRVRTASITRVVTLLTNAMRASGNMGPVLRIASEQARAELKLRQQRTQQMITYLVVIYISFFVFLVIIMAVNQVLVPSLPETVPTPEGPEADRLGASPDSIARFGEVDQAAYTLIFFHAALIQAVCAGFIGGQLGEGSLRDGAKHAAILLLVAYVAFVLISSPIASITLESQEVQGPDGVEIFEVTSDGSAIFDIREVTLSDGGFIAAYDGEEGINGTLLGHTEYLAPGKHSDIVIPLHETISEDTTVRLVVHHDTNDNQQFDFQGPYLPSESQVDGPYGSPAENERPGLNARVQYIGG